MYNRKLGHSNEDIDRVRLNETSHQLVSRNILEIFFYYLGVLSHSSSLAALCKNRIWRQRQCGFNPESQSAGLCQCNASFHHTHFSSLSLCIHNNIDNLKWTVYFVNGRWRPILNSVVYDQVLGKLCCFSEFCEYVTVKSNIQ